MERVEYVSWETPLQYFEEGDLTDKIFLHFTSQTWYVVLWFWFSVFSLSSYHTHISKIIWSFFGISCGRKILRSVVPQVVPGALMCSCHQWQTPLQNKILQQLMLSCLWGTVPGLGCLTYSWEEHESIALESLWRCFQWQDSVMLPSVGWCLYWCALPFIWWVASFSIIFFPAAEHDVASGSSIMWLCCGWKWSVVFSWFWSGVTLKKKVVIMKPKKYS